MANQIQILEYINILRDKPYMLVNKIDGYNTYEGFLNGFFYGIDIGNNFSISKNFSSWLGDYYKIENTNLHWASFLRIRFEKITEEEMIKTLFELLNKFFEDNSLR